MADTRVAGADRYATSVAIANALGSTAGITAGNFVIASGDNFPDALAASALAGAISARVILVPADGTLSPGAIALLTGASKVRIIGGTAAVSQALELNLLKVTGPGLTAGQFVRISGSNRYETAAAVSMAIQAELVPTATVGLKRTAIVVSGENFADAVLAAPVAYRGPSSQPTGVHPVLLTEPGSLNASTQQRLISLGVQQVVIVGGESAVSSGVEASIKALGLDVIRVGGADRYATATALAGVLTTSEAAGGFGWPKTTVGVANLSAGANGADALASAPWFGISRAPLIGTAGDSVPAATSAYLDANKATVGSILVAGGLAAVPAAVVTAAKDAAGSLARPTATIAALEGALFANVTFSEAVTLASAGAAANYAAVKPDGNLNVVTGVSYNPTTRVAKVSVTSPLTTGTTIRVLAAKVAATDTRTVAQTDFVVTADTTAPVATVTASIGSTAFGAGNNQVMVTFDKPVRSIPAALTEALTVNGVAITTNAPTLSLAGGAGSLTTGFDTALFTTPSQLVAGAVVGFKAQQVGILGTLGATLVQNAAASTTVVADLVRPTVIGVPSFTLVNVPASGSYQGVQITANKAGAAGVLGNTVILNVTNSGTPGTVAVASTSTLATAALANTALLTGNTVTISVQIVGGTSTAAQVVAAINANTVAASLVTAAVVGSPTSTLAVMTGVGTSLAGGLTYANISVAYSEAIGTTLGVSLNSGRTVGSPSSTVSASPGVAFPAASAAPFVIGSTTVVYQAAITQGPDVPLANTAKLWFHSVDHGTRDLAGNRVANSLPATGLTLVAG